LFMHTLSWIPTPPAEALDDGKEQRRLWMTERSSGGSG